MIRFYLSLFVFAYSITPCFSLQAQTDYRIGPEDVIQISVYEEPDLSLEIRVSADGHITYPLLGRVEVAGLTPQELEQKLIELLEKDFLVDPQVSVVIKGYGNIYVIGEVRQPGPYQLSPNMTLMTALALAGGITDAATQDQVRVVRHAGESREIFEISLSDITQEGMREKDIQLKPNDVVLVRKSASGNVYVLGQVIKPGEYPMKDKLTVVEAISLAGGLTKVAAPNRTRVIRVEDGVKKVIKVPVNKILQSGEKKRDVVLKSDDVIVVPESFF